MLNLKSATVGVVGAGTMGAGIAQVAATAGHEVVLTDTSQRALDKARAGLEKILKRLAKKERISSDDARDILARIRFERDIHTVADCGLVIEAIVEQLDAKRSVFAQLETLVARGAVLATNTSSLPVTAVASACELPSRVVGVHFFNPAPLMALVELVPGLETSEEVFTGVRSLVDGWGKVTVRAKDTPGFIVNRVARPFYSEALRLLDEGIADVATIDAAMRELGGFRMGPFELMDLIGNDINYAVTESVYRAFYYDPRYRPSFTQKRMVEAGWLGRKTGRGYYRYDDGTPEEPAPLRDAVQGQAIVDRIVAMLINEAIDAVFWKAASAADIDLAMTKGVNYPRGLLAWAREIGLPVVLKRMEELRETYAEDRYRASPLLRRMVAEGGVPNG